MRAMKLVRRTVAILAVFAVMAGALILAQYPFQRRMNREIDALLADAHSTQPRIVSERDLAHLPDPVQRWLRHSRVPGTSIPTTVRLRQRGEFLMDQLGWVPYRAEQYFTIDKPGFVWRAGFRLAPFVSVNGRDMYRAGEASMQMRVMSLISVANKKGGGLNQGDLLRFLGETQWFPAAALAPYIKWDPVDANSARATMSYAGVTASMTFRFDPDGRPTECTAARYNDARGQNETWVNTNNSEEDFGEWRVSAAGEARWDYTTGPYAYIRWQITNIEPDHPTRYDR